VNRYLLTGVAAIVAAGCALHLAGIVEGPDAFNGTLESVGGLFIAMSVLKLHEEKQVRGVSWMHVGFFSCWGYWNIYYYAYLDQWFSWAGGLFLALTNSLWLFQILYYLWLERRSNVVA
jgi:hypothetical protein